MPLKEMVSNNSKHLLTLLTLLTIGAILLSPDRKPREHGYGKVWQPCTPVDTNTVYLDDEGLNTVGAINNAVGCPVEVWEYVSIGEFEGHSEILK